MLNRILFILILICSLSEAAPKLLDQYDSTKKIMTTKEFNIHYIGTLCATGGAIADINRKIEKMAPVIVGEIKPQTLVIHEEDTTQNQAYHISKIKYYEVFSGERSYNVMYAKAYLNEKPNLFTRLFGKNNQYEILIEMNGHGHYDRTLYIYKNGKPHTLVLWIDTLRVKTKNKV
jgi:hypothetical protein